MRKLLTALILSLSLFGYNIKEFVTCKDVVNLEPVGITQTFSNQDKKVFAFAYFTDIKQNKKIDFVWEKNVNGKWKLYADIQLPIFTGVRWRTYSNITVRPFFTGKWRVSIVDGNTTVSVKEFNITSSE